jgi:hypothetical protein
MAGEWQPTAGGTMTVINPGTERDKPDEKHAISEHRREPQQVLATSVFAG